MLATGTGDLYWRVAWEAMLFYEVLHELHAIGVFPNLFRLEDVRINNDGIRGSSDDADGIMLIATEFEGAVMSRPLPIWGVSEFLGVCGGVI